MNVMDRPASMLRTDAARGGTARAIAIEVPWIRWRRRLRTAVRAAAGFDPRVYQITVLGSLLVYGIARLGFDIHPAQAIAILVTALATQLAGTCLTALPRFDPRSALISGLSLCLLLRTHDPTLALAGAVAAVGSKFVLRVRGKHVFNPTN